MLFTQFLTLNRRKGLILRLFYSCFLLDISIWFNFGSMLVAECLTLNSVSSFSSCLEEYACLGFLSTPGFLALRPTGFGAKMR